MKDPEKQTGKHYINVCKYLIMIGTFGQRINPIIESGMTGKKGEYFLSPGSCPRSIRACSSVSPLHSHRQA